MINRSYDKITRIFKAPFSPGAVTGFVENPACSFEVQDECYLTKIDASCRANNAAGANIAVPLFGLTINTGAGACLDQNSVGINSTLNQLFSTFHGKYSVLQNVEINYPQGLQVNKVGIVSVILDFRFAAAFIGTDQLQWNIDFYFASPEPITILFEDVTK